MSLRVDQRADTLPELEVYSKCIKLTSHTMSVCKIKENGSTNNKHLVKRQIKVGEMLVNIVIQIGTNILEANNKYVKENLNLKDRLQNYEKRLELQEEAKSLTYKVEHIIRVLHFDRPFADSTLTYWMELLTETRNLLVKWKQNDYSNYKKLLNNEGID